jgi:opacity protein-like surface antigen
MRYSQEGECEMFRFVSTVIAVAVFTGSLVSAQESTPKVQAFGGFSLLHQRNGTFDGTSLDVALGEPGGTFQPTTNFKGWNAEAQYNADRWLGIAVDFNGRYGSPIRASSISKVSGLPDATSYSFLIGPVISYRTKSRAIPFVHALIGIDRTSLKASTISGLPSPVTSAATTYTDVAFALGGGLDFKLTQHFGFRVAQVDYFRTTLNENKFYQSAFGPGLFASPATKEGNIRFSTGVLIQF